MCHADTTGLKQGTLGREARDCWDPHSSVTARALGWTDWPPRSTAAAVRETESGLEMRACARCERPARTGGARADSDTSSDKRAGGRVGRLLFGWYIYVAHSRRYARGS